LTAHDQHNTAAPAIEGTRLALLVAPESAQPLGRPRAPVIRRGHGSHEDPAGAAYRRRVFGISMAAGR